MGQTKARVVFKNQPKLSEYAVQNDFNERRLSLVPHIKDFVEIHDLFNDTEVSITFSNKGVASLVAVLETSTEKLILKIPLAKTFSGGEGLFLRTWERIGIKVPHVLEEGVLDAYSYTLMEYIDAPLLAEAFSPQECIDKGIYLKLGRILRLMHTPEARGYGRVANGKAEYVDFKDWLNNADLWQTIEYVQERQLLTGEHGDLSLALKILTEHVDKEGRSSYCHNDFGGNNIFATEPLTVFDPNPQFNSGYLDLGRSLVHHFAVGISPDQLIEGYFEDRSYDKKALQAAVLLNSYLKLSTWHQKDKTDYIRNIQENCLQNKHLLETN